MVAEWLWIMTGRNDVATISAYNKQIAAFSDNGITFFGAYGPQVIRQLPQIIELLRKDPDTRQAVLNIWQPLALQVPTKDVPCTLTWQFFIRGGKLELHANMRSNDVWLGLPYDLFNFTQVQRAVANELDLACGDYVHHVGSLHLYEQHYAVAQTTAADRGLDIPPATEPTLDMPPELRSILVDGAAGATRDELMVLYSDLHPRWHVYAAVLIRRFYPELQDLLLPPFRVAA
jgi:thymidylate synthase